MQCEGRCNCLHVFPKLDIYIFNNLSKIKARLYPYAFVETYSAAILVPTEIALVGELLIVLPNNYRPLYDQ